MSIGVRKFASFHYSPSRARGETRIERKRATVLTRNFSVPAPGYHGLFFSRQPWHKEKGSFRGREEDMKVTEKQIAERYAAMTDDELLALEPQKLTAEAAALREAELERRGVADTPEAQERRERQQQAREAGAGRNRKRQLAALAVVAAALLTELASIRLLDIPPIASGVVVVVLCVLSLWLLRRRR